MASSSVDLPVTNQLEKEDEESYVTSTNPSEKGDAETVDFPEGGLEAWGVVLGATCLVFASFGYGNSWGIYQGHYATNNLKNSSTSDIGWIGSVQFAFLLVPSLLSGRLLDTGHIRAPIALASIGEIVAVFLSAECKEYWQFLLCQGLLLGLSAGFIFGPAFAVTAHWFEKRRVLVYSIVASGASIGGVVFPLLTRKALETVGFKWTMRITGFVLVFLLGIANLLVRRRLPAKQVNGGLFNLAIFKNVAWSLYAAASLLNFLGGYTILFYADVGAEEGGLNLGLSQSLVAVANGASFFGRILAGYLASRVGPFNLLIPGNLLLTITQWIWPYITHQTGSTLVLVILYGLANGAVVGVIASPMSHAAFGSQEDLGRRIGMLFTVCAIGALTSTPIAGAIRTDSGSYKAVGWWSGTITLLAAILLVFSRRAATGKWLVKY